MSLKRSLSSCILLSAITLGICAERVDAAEYPDRRINFLVAASAGGYADGVARVVGQRLSEELGQSVVVENRGGAGGNIAAKIVATSAPDGYTVLVTTTQLAINQTLYKNAGVTASDFRAISIPVSAPETILTHPSNPAKDLKDLVERAKGGTITFGSAGTGTGSYIQAEYFFKKIAKVNTIHVPFAGGAPALSALLGNHVPVIAITVSPAISAINQGTIRGLGIASPERMPFVKSVPTYAENGYPNYFASSWIGFFVPAKTPEDVVKKLNASIGKVMADPAVKSRLEPFGVHFIHGSLAQTSQFFDAEVSRWGEMVHALGLSVE